MTLHAISIPKWGLSMEEGTLASWLVAEGTEITAGIEIAEIETTKITNVLESQVAGVLRRQIVAAGEVRRVGALIGVVSDADEDEAAIETFIGEWEARFGAEAESLPSSPEPQSLTLGTRQLRFLRAPSQSAKAAIPVILLHGFGGDHLNWLFNQSVLAEQRDVYALDLPGHGGSSKDVGDGSMDALAGVVLEGIDALGLSEVHLVGHSMGAGVALALALMAPDRIRSLVAICGAGFGGALNQDYIRGFLAASNRKQLKPVVVLLFAQPELATREMLDDLANYKRIDGVAEALAKLAGVALSETSLQDLAERASGVRSPVLSIHGSADQVMRRAALLPAGAVLIEGAGHMPQLEAADTVNGHIAAFLHSYDSKSSGLA